MSVNDSKMINPIEMLGPVECRHCGNTMSVIVSSADAIHLDDKGSPYDISSLLSEIYLLCSKCGNKASFIMEPDTLTYKIVDEVDEGVQRENATEVFTQIPQTKNPFITNQRKIITKG